MTIKDTISKWRLAFIKHHMKLKTLPLFYKGKYYYEGKILQEKANGHFYYKKMIYEVDI